MLMVIWALSGETICKLLCFFETVQLETEVVAVGVLFNSRDIMATCQQKDKNI
jgi:hypothetical protein